MKQILSTLTFLIITSICFSQSDVDEDIKMNAKYSSNNSEIRDILSFEKIDYFNIDFTGTELIGKDYSLIVKEIWEGEVTSIDTLVNTSENERLNELSNDTLSFKVFAQKVPSDKLKLYFIFQNFRFSKEYSATESNDYSLRVIGNKINIEPNKTFYAMAYILPYEKDGWKYWCAVDSSGGDVLNWGKEFKIKHYLVFEMKFE